MDLKQNAFLRQWIYYKKPLQLGKANKFSLHSLNRGFAPHWYRKNNVNVQKHKVFFMFFSNSYFALSKKNIYAQSMLLGIFFFNNRVLDDLL